MIPVGDNDNNRKLTPGFKLCIDRCKCPDVCSLSEPRKQSGIHCFFFVVPEEIITGTNITTGGLGISPSPIYFTLITSMFMHCGISICGYSMITSKMLWGI